jgi:hypothetical protein
MTRKAGMNTVAIPTTPLTLDEMSNFIRGIKRLPVAFAPA